MPTAAQYLTIVGDERIVSLQNADPTDVPKNLDFAPPIGIYPNGPGTPQKGNRKIAIKVLVPVEGADPQYDADQTLTLKVKVPDGNLAAPGLQKFDATTPEGDYLPQAKLIAQNLTAISKFAYATPIIGSENVADQTLDILIQLNLLAGPLDQKDTYAIFLVEIDWSYSASN